MLKKELPAHLHLDAFHPPITGILDMLVELTGKPREEVHQFPQFLRLFATAETECAQLCASLPVDEQDEQSTANDLATALLSAVSATDVFKHCVAKMALGVEERIANFKKFVAEYVFTQFPSDHFMDDDWAIAASTYLLPPCGAVEPPTGAPGAWVNVQPHIMEMMQYTLDEVNKTADEAPCGIPE